MKKTIPIRNVRWMLMLVDIALVIILLMETTVDAASSNSVSIEKIREDIKNQQEIITTYQAKIVKSSSENTSKINSYNHKIDDANLKIAAQYALIAQLESNSPASVMPPTTPSLSTPALRNMTSSDLVLTHIASLNVACNPACVPGTPLPPGAMQPYSFIAPTGFIIFDYDVRDSSGITGHLTIAARSRSVTLTNGLGGGITQGANYSGITYTPPTAWWRGEFTSLQSWAVNNWNVTKSLSSWGMSNIEVRASQPGESSPDGKNYLRVHYPAGSANYQSAPPVGGAQFYGAILSTAAPVTLSFYMLLPTNFPFLSPTRGTTVGKLPGLYGGIGNTGSNVPTGKDGWTTRFMWCDYNKATKQKFTGGGEILQFTVGSNHGTFGTVNGTFLGCGVWKFLADGKWHNVQQTIHLNDIGKANGRIDVCIDGLAVFTQTNVTFRTVDTLQTNGIIFQTFFGGGDKSYATPIDTYADFADFAVYMYPQTAPLGLCITNP